MLVAFRHSSWLLIISFAVQRRYASFFIIDLCHLSTIKIAILLIAKVFTVRSLGLLMASLAHGRKLLNGLVISLLLPCLIFSQLRQAIIGEKILEW
ncbi:hypothetical protein RchiOBHm_Chr4g0414971 [Rosa chinensis]|uniref:Uncharacterized protein n=1 Tax=Rosa chinensis TaxID=74649 RepID=A0A2P6QWH9_ROSCH|nr:hypothetical protein RchiOBHm_Chr4g0414971 [Rosa chinensis]